MSDNVRLKHERIQSPLRQIYPPKKATVILSNKSKQEYNFLGCDPVYSGRMLPTFEEKNFLLPFSGWKRTPSKEL
jgi:hypothetical protein